MTSRRDGKRVLYRLASEHVLHFLSALRAIGERNVAEARQTINEYFLSRDAMEPLANADLARSLKQKSIVLLDVRPEGEFALGHVSGAINVPLKDLGRKLRTLPRGKEIVAYCRGPYCVLSFEAVALLRERGFKARRLEGGLPECAAAGISVTAGA